MYLKTYNYKIAIIDFHHDDGGALLVNGRDVELLVQEPAIGRIVNEYIGSGCPKSSHDFRV